MPTQIPTPTPTPTPINNSQQYRVLGNQILNPDSSTHIFKGINRPSLEWISTGEHLSLDDYKKMQSWGFNVVRLPLNQRYWLTDNNYKNLVAQNVEWINSLNMDAILVLHWSDKGGDDVTPAQQRMPDTRSVQFWHEVAGVYKDNPKVLFEVYNEPRDVSPQVWLNGGDTGDGFEAVGMQTLVNIIRNEVKAENLIIINGLNWAYDHSQLSRISGNNIVYGTHVYGEYYGKQRPDEWDKAFGFLINSYPVIATEFGNGQQCDGGFSNDFINYLENKQQSWVSWAWYPGGCGFPSVIDNWDGTANAVGKVIQSHLK